ncbi:MAG: SGNH/GDSL hydrolase family protein [Lachnospiraceae bacterium]
MKTILCYGDSNTFGLKSDLVNRYPREVRWTGVLQNCLGEAYYVIEEGLGGRTTVWDDPVEEHKNGKKYLCPCLDSHKPINLIILVLGTNDLKGRFSVSGFDVAKGMENLLKTILKSDTGIDFHPPQILLIPPVPIQDVGNKMMNEMIPGGVEKSLELAGYYKGLAEQYKTHYLDPAGCIEINQEDGVHYTENGHRKMAEILYDKVIQILE